MLPGAAEIGAQTGLPLQMNSDMRTCLHVIKIDFVYKRICPPLCTNFKLCQNLKLLKLGMHVHLDKIQVLSNLARVITLATEWIKLCPLFNLEKKGASVFALRRSYPCTFFMEIQTTCSMLLFIFHEKREFCLVL